MCARAGKVVVVAMGAHAVELLLVVDVDGASIGDSAAEVDGNITSLSSVDEDTDSPMSSASAVSKLSESNSKNSSIDVRRLRPRIFETVPAEEVHSKERRTRRKGIKRKNR